jgi:dTDP-3-amino-3,4,6-trideoxy-alpha-D-glucose transaminase
MQVLLNDFRRQWQAIRADALRVLDRVGASGWYILGDEVHRFEQALADVWPVGHAVGVGSGLDAIEIALRCVGLKTGDRVLTTPLSAFATTLAVVRAGAVPVFVDVDANGLLDLDRCLEVMARDSAIRWLLPVHLYGQAMDLGRLHQVAEKTGAIVVEDCAQSIGALFDGVATGTVGAAAATSFYPTKNLGAMGDGGAVLTSSPAVAEKAKALRHYGQTATYVHDHLGLNSRLDEVHAALLVDVFLPRLALWTARRRQIAARYHVGIENPRIRLLPVAKGSEPVWHLFPVLVGVTGRDAFMRHLRERGVASGVHYPTLIPEQQAMRDCRGFEVLDDLANARQFAGGEVSLPIHPLLTDAEVEVVVSACNSWSGA